MRITTNFLIKTTKEKPDGTFPIYVRVTLKRKRIELSTGVYVNVENWDHDKQKIDPRDLNAKVLNIQLSKTITKINDVYNQLEAIGEDYDIYSIKDRLTKNPQHFIVKTFNVVMDSIYKQIGYGYSLTTYKHYKTTLKRLQTFLKLTYKKEDYSLSKIDYNFINSFDTYLKLVHHISPQSVGKYHKQMKKVLNDAVSMNLIERNPYINFKIKRYTGNRDYLTIEELRVIERKEILFDRLSEVRDIFMFACYTGLSYSDIYKLSKKHIVKGNDKEKWIVIDRNKTDNRCRIPLLPKAKAILKKYKKHPQAKVYNRLLPIRTNQRMNAYLKEIAGLTGIEKNLSMHVARHTFATSITLANGVPIETVSKMLGHNSIKTTQIYGRILDSKISTDMWKLKTLF